MTRLAGAALLVSALWAGTLAAQARSTDRYVGKVRFSGNKALDEVLLTSSIATTSSGWLYRSFLHLGERQAFDETEFRRDVVRLQLLYRQHGFYEARIDTTIRRKGRFIDPTFQITEGPPILIDSVRITGIDSIPGNASLGHNLLIGPGHRFDRVDFDASGDSIALGVVDRGYPYSTVFRNFTVNRVTRRATAQFDVLAGPHATIGEIAIVGNQKINEATVRRALTIRVGDEYRRTALYNSQRALYQSELYRYANVGIATPDSTVNGQDSLVKVRVQVAEADPLRARAGVGYGTIDCLRASGTVTVLNFLGRARRLDLVSRVSKIGASDPLDFGLRSSLCRELEKDSLYSSKVNYLGSVTLSQPVGWVRGAVASVQVFKERRSEFSVYLLTTVGGAVSLRFGIGRNRGIPLTLSYRLSNDQVTSADAQFCVYFNQCDSSRIAAFRLPRRQGTLSATMVSQRVDSPIEPTTGQTITIELAAAARPLASQIAFQRTVVEGVIYRPAGRHRVLSARLRGGVILQGKSTIGGAPYLPPSEAFYAGGPTTVRGFRRNEMGPVVYVYDTLITTRKDSLVGLRSSPLGSSAMILSNVELRVPTPLLGGRLGMSVFVDGGELWTYDGTRYRAGGFKITPGVGFQIATPLGPMRLTSAYNAYGRQAGPLYRISGTNLVREGDYPGSGSGGSFLSHLQWHFSVGLAF